MSSRKPLDSRASTLMLLLCVIWGLQQIAIKAASHDMAPILQIGLRSGAAALLVGIFLRVKRMNVLPASGALPAGLLAGGLFSLEYLFVGEGLRFTTASHMSVMLYTAPVFAALGLHFLAPEERLSAIQWGGVLIAFCGVVIVFYNPSDSGRSLENIVLGDFLGLLAGVAWGATTIVIRASKLAECPAAQTVFIQLVSAFVILLAASIILDKTAINMTEILVSSLLYQTVIVSFASFLAWLWLLRVYLASRLGVLSFLTPVFGVIFGALLLDEKIDMSFIAGSAFVLFGVLLVSGARTFKAYFHRFRLMR